MCTHLDDKIRRLLRKRAYFCCCAYRAHEPTRIVWVDLPPARGLVDQPLQLLLRSFTALRVDILQPDLWHLRTHKRHERNAEAHLADADNRDL